MRQGYLRDQHLDQARNTKEKTGDRLVMSINETADGQYSGTAFDPQRNLTYKISVKVDGDTMTTNGCVLAGLLCRNVGWTRIK